MGRKHTNNIKAGIVGLAGVGKHVRKAKFVDPASGNRWICGSRYHKNEKVDIVTEIHDVCVQIFGSADFCVAGPPISQSRPHNQSGLTGFACCASPNVYTEQLNALADLFLLDASPPPSIVPSKPLFTQPQAAEEH